MPLRTITFPRLLLVPRQGGMQLSLHMYITLDLPESLPELHTYSKLVETVQDEQLWIARHGISHFTVELTNNGFQTSELDRVRLTDWFERHEIWGRLGVMLVRSAYMPDMIQFSIQHPDITSCLAAPGEALTAEFKEVRCVMDVQTCSKVKQSVKGMKRRKTQQMSHDVRSDCLKDLINEQHGPIETDLYELLDPADQAAIDEFLSGPGVPNPSNKRRRRASISGPLKDIENARSLIKGSVEIALFGGSRRVNGVKVLEGTGTRGLTQLLPGVFHMPHLKATSDRASLIPVIATSLARMTKAESPSLRRQTKDFKYGLPSLDMEANELEKIIRGIERAAWCTLLKNIKPPALKPKPSSQSTHYTPQQPTTPAEGGSERERRLTLVLGEIFTPRYFLESQGSISGSLEPGRHLTASTGEVTGQPNLLCSAPTSTLQDTTQGKQNLGFLASLDSSLTVNSLPVMSSAFPTPLPNDRTSSTYSPHHDFQVSNSPKAMMEFSQADIYPVQGHSPPSFVGSAQYYPSTSPVQDYFSSVAQDRDSYVMGSQETSTDSEFTQDAMRMTDPAASASFEGLLGDASMLDWGWDSDFKPAECFESNGI